MEIKVWYTVVSEDGEIFEDIPLHKLPVDGSSDVADFKNLVKTSHPDALKDVDANKFQIFPNKSAFDAFRKSSVSNPSLSPEVPVLNLGATSSSCVYVVVPKRKTIKSRVSEDYCPDQLFQLPEEEVMEEDKVMEGNDSDDPEVIHVFEDLAQKLRVNSSLMKRSCYGDFRKILIQLKTNKKKFMLRCIRSWI